MTKSKLLTTAQAAKLIGVAPSRIRRLILDGRLKAEKPGHDWLIKPADLARLKINPTGRPKKGS